MKKCCNCNKGEMLTFYRRRDDIVINVCDYCGYTVEDEQAAKDGVNVICSVCAGSGSSYEGNNNCVKCNGAGYVKIK
jgi:hypothetical protein|nr:MAG TPA: TRYPTOPHAN RNA-BINDING ATTENUATOR PROTEIN-INHIBITORY PROTEIN REGULATION, ANTI-TRAP [Caudoviricetes sp.]